MANVLLETFWIDSRLNGTTSSASSSIALANGIDYELVIDGNWTAWTDADLVHGDLTVPILYASPGGTATKAAFDYEVQWASADAGTYPAHGGAVWLSTGGAFSHMEVVGGPTTTRDAAHEYTVLVIGAGSPLRAGVADAALSDNNGLIRVRIYGPGLGPTVGYIGPGAQF